MSLEEVKVLETMKAKEVQEALEAKVIVLETVEKIVN